MKPIIFAAILMAGCAADYEPTRNIQQRVADLCKEKGGVPIVDGFNKVIRCDFPCSYKE